MEIYKFLQAYMDEHNLKIAEVARICSLPDSTVRGIIARKQKSVALEVAFKLSDGLNVSLEKLNGTPEQKRRSNVSLSSNECNIIKKYRTLDEHGKKLVDNVLNLECERVEISAAPIEPISNIITLSEFEQPVSAGKGVYLGDGSQTITREVPSTENTRKADYILRVSGNSMEPEYFDGDKLLIKRQPNVEIGEIGVFVLNNEGFVKKYMGDKLISLNPKYEDIIFSAYDNINCAGLVLGKL